MKNILPLVLTLVFLLPQITHADNTSDAKAELKKHPFYQQGYLSKEESLKSLQVPEGYKLELVLSEPHIKEPVAIAWDGNGVMYVAEMRTYMQDADATGEQTPRSRISRHEDTNGDGVYDKHSVFIDNLLLPRMILPLDDSIMVGITNTLDLWEYRDTDGDGVADEKTKIYNGGKRGGNMEHQPNGLIWGLDNWIYITYEAIRYRYTDGKLVTEKLPLGCGQWGLTQDDDGRNYYSRAGGEVVTLGFQQPALYGVPRLKNEISKKFQEIFPIAQVPDVQGGPRRVGANGAINHFTAVAGQEIFRGDALPADLYGDLLSPEPVGRFIRRAKVLRTKAKTTFANATPGSEFIRTRDVYFRPVQNVTGPDGCLYIVDMHRGIIQQGNWTRPESYLRAIIDETGLAKAIGHGRIYRLTHKDHKPGSRPQMRKQTTAALVRHLTHPNGWWRDTAKKLIILRKDRNTVVPTLEKLALHQPQKIQSRITALWTLEGCSAVREKLLLTLLTDKNPRILTHAIRVSEPLIKQGSPSILTSIQKLAQTTDPEIALQLYNSIRYAGSPAALSKSMDTLLARHGKSETLAANQKRYLQALADAAQRKKNMQTNAALTISKQRGKATYQMICFACHGNDGTGQPLAGQKGHFLAPSLVGSSRVLGTGSAVTLALLHGMQGAIDGKTYDGLMPAQQNNTDQWIADVTTYIRNSFGNTSPAITPTQVASIRKQHSHRKKAWTQQELENLDPPKLNNRHQWKLNARYGKESLKLSLDGNGKTRYTTGKKQRPNHWITIELPHVYQLSQLTLDTLRSSKNHPLNLRVETSLDGKKWHRTVPAIPAQAHTTIPLSNTTARWLKISINRNNGNNQWSIHELNLFGKKK